MKLKRLFAGILAVAMMATMAAPAFATSSSSGVKSYEDAFNATEAQSVSLTKVLKVQKGTAPDNMTFTFKVYDENKDTSTEMSGFSKSVTFNTTSTVFDTTHGDSTTNGTYTRTFALNILALLQDTVGTGNTAKVGTYTYKIVEQSNTYQSVVAEWNTVYMTVTKVNGDTDGTYKYYVVLRKDEKSGEKVQGTEAFKNVYGGKNTDNSDNVNTLILSKTVHGNLGDQTQTFQFKVKFTKKTGEGITNGDYKGPKVTWNETDATIVKQSDNSTVNTGSYLSLDTDYIVTLGHKKSINFENLPDGIEYNITELGDAVDGTSSIVSTDGKVTVNNISYNVTVNGNIANKTGGVEVKQAVSGSMDKADVTKAFHNTNESTVDTGVILDNAPYIALLLIAAAGAAVMVVKKRRREE